MIETYFFFKTILRSKAHSPRTYFSVRFTPLRLPQKHPKFDGCSFFFGKSGISLHILFQTIIEQAMNIFFMLLTAGSPIMFHKKHVQKGGKIPSS